ncbi:MAG: 30S ribosomal protein S6 [Patescibacteria group bacterium]|nr:30S ribosomal protein S6 [Patescibacteria group bacterium]
MKKYEISFIVSENYTEDRAADIAKDVKKLIESKGGKVEKEVFWGKRKLIYKIAKNSFGYYYVFIFDIKPEETNKLNKELNLNEKILRYLIVDFIEGSPFFEEGALDKPKRGFEEKNEEETRRPRKFAKKKEVEEVKEENPPVGVEAVEAPVEKIKEENQELGIKNQEEESDEPVGAQYIAPEQGEVETNKKEREIAKEEIVEPAHIDSQSDADKEKPAKEAEMEERKPVRKQMTEAERKEQLEKKLAELLKDEEL